MSPSYEFPTLLPERLKSRLFRNRKPAERKAIVLALCFGLAMLVLLVIGLTPRLMRLLELNRLAVADSQTIPRVFVVNARRSSDTVKFQLPGDVQSWEEATIYARTDGFLKSWLADRGDRVKSGQLLAVVDSPEADDQLLQAQHELAQSRASLFKDRSNLDYARLTKERWVTLQREGAVSHQDADTNINLYKEALHQVQADEQLIRANEANVKRLTALKSFEHVTAPFDGIITDRRVNTGDLITAGSTSATTNLFKVARIETVRIFVQVPQRYAGSVQDGQDATVTVQELPGKAFAGRVTRNANELDMTARTLLTEIDVDNPDGTLLPGMYSQVSIASKLRYSPVIVPGNALVIRPSGPQVAIVTPQNRIHFQVVELGRDYGNEVEVVTGLAGQERLVVNPTDRVREGRQVEAIPQPAG